MFRIVRRYYDDTVLVTVCPDLETFYDVFMDLQNEKFVDVSAIVIQSWDEKRHEWARYSL